MASERRPTVAEISKALSMRPEGQTLPSAADIAHARAALETQYEAEAQARMERWERDHEKWEREAEKRHREYLRVEEANRQRIMHLEAAIRLAVKESCSAEAIAYLEELITHECY
jgi:hypothetical protein